MTIYVPLVVLGVGLMILIPELGWTALLSLSENSHKCKDII